MHRSFTLRRAGLLVIGICRPGPPDFRTLPIGALTLFRDAERLNGEAKVYPCGKVYDWEAIKAFAPKP